MRTFQNTMKRRRSSLSSSKHAPPSEADNEYSSCRQLAVVPTTPRKGRNKYSNCRQLAVVPPTTTALGTFTTRSSFKLPKGWGVEEVHRPSNASQVDRYYYEPRTGVKFRSLRSVEKHLKGEEYTPISRDLIVRNQSPRYPKMIIINGQMVRLDNDVSNANELAITASTRIAKCSLPDGWVVEEVPRKDGRYDRNYYEPGTGRKFRSQIAAQRYLEELDEDRPLSETLNLPWENAPLSKIFKLGCQAKNPVSCKKKETSENTQKSSFVNRPKKVKWVIASSQGVNWNPFIGEAPIPDSVKNQWTKRFMLIMNDGNYDAHDSNMQK